MFVKGKEESCDTCVDHCGWVWQGGLSLLQTENCKKSDFVSFWPLTFTWWDEAEACLLCCRASSSSARCRLSPSVPAPELPQSFRHQPKSIFLAPVPPQGFQWFSPLLGSPPRFFQINNKYLKSLKNKSECNYSWWKKLGYNSVIMPHLVFVSVNDSVGSFYEGDSNL